MGAYKRDVVVVINMGAYIHVVLILCGCLLSRFYGISPKHGSVFNTRSNDFIRRYIEQVTSRKRQNCFRSRCEG